eukprot:CAMPEP_0119419816 /NCGR_PEP_ID=MMETSP1335-20130426/21844_1 /TAXON_ID=259385 /ORGANISM="Chrysoculter rhomboideus, Strain RCC1486" /LENGTH=200 /DNA_ID=CAMNT_0007445141 /DNA_START=144 /DNA_END=743 /DNA_ORIENTATION=-
MGRDGGWAAWEDVGLRLQAEAWGRAARRWRPNKEVVLENKLVPAHGEDEVELRLAREHGIPHMRVCRGQPRGRLLTRANLGVQLPSEREIERGEDHRHVVDEEAQVMLRAQVADVRAARLVLDCDRVHVARCEQLRNLGGRAARVQHDRRINVHLAQLACDMAACERPVPRWRVQMVVEHDEDARRALSVGARRSEARAL